MKSIQKNQKFNFEINAKNGIEFGPTERSYAPALSLSESGLRLKVKNFIFNLWRVNPRTWTGSDTGLGFKTGFSLKIQRFYAIFDGFRPELNFQYTTHKNRKERAT